MKAALFLFRLPQRIRRRLRNELRTWVLPLPIIAYLWSSNRFGKASVVSGEGPVVSLTSYGERIRTVYLTIESIGRGRRLPSRLILWIDDPFLFGNLPLPLHRLMKRGLEVRLCKNYGPHTKYYPYLESTERFLDSLVTADDDILYPRNWLEQLVIANEREPDLVLCHRAHVVGFCREEIAPYTAWEPCRSVSPAARNFATGVSGILYPPAFLRRLKPADRGFESCCPKADDIWLHVQAVRTGFPICQVTNRPRLFLMIPRTQDNALALGNWEGGGNDRQIAATYEPDDIRKLLLEQTASLCAQNVRD
jgi:hypothetical protein